MTPQIIGLGVLLVANLMFVFFIVRSLSDVAAAQAEQADRLAKVERRNAVLRRAIKDLAASYKRLLAKVGTERDETERIVANLGLKEIIDGAEEPQTEGRWKARGDGTFEMGQ